MLKNEQYNTIANLPEKVTPSSPAQKKQLLFYQTKFTTTFLEKLYESYQIKFYRVDFCDLHKKTFTAHKLFDLERCL